MSFLHLLHQNPVFSVFHPKAHGIAARRSDVLCGRVLCQRVTAQRQDVTRNYDGQHESSTFCPPEVSHLIFTSLPVRVITISRPVLQMKTLRLREAAELARGLTLREWGRPAWLSGPRSNPSAPQHLNALPLGTASPLSTAGSRRRVQTSAAAWFAFTESSLSDPDTLSLPPSGGVRATFSFPPILAAELLPRPV